MSSGSAFVLHMCLLVVGSATCMGPTCAADVPPASNAAALLQSMKMTQQQLVDGEYESGYESSYESGYEAAYDEATYDETTYGETTEAEDAPHVLESGVTLALPPLESVPLEYLQAVFESDDTLSFFKSVLSASLAVPETDVTVLFASVSDSPTASATTGARLLSKAKSIRKKQYPQAAHLFNAKNIKTNKYPQAALLFKADSKKLKKTQKATEYEITIKFSVLESQEAASKISSLGLPGTNEQATFVTTIAEGVAAAATASTDGMFLVFAAAIEQDGISVEKVDEVVIKPCEEPVQEPDADEVDDSPTPPPPPPPSPPPVEDIPGYVATEMWSEVCGKSCDTAGVTCDYEPSSTEACALRCDALDECMAFQMPEADNGFHGWCVWFDYNVQPQDNSHYCHEGNYVYNKEVAPEVLEPEVPEVPEDKSDSEVEEPTPRTSPPSTSTAATIAPVDCSLSQYELDQEHTSGVSCCGREGDTCVCTGEVRFGTYGLDWQDWQEYWSSWQSASAMGSISCSSASFGFDPAPGYGKICQCKA